MIRGTGSMTSGTNAGPVPWVEPQVGTALELTNIPKTAVRAALIAGAGWMIGLPISPYKLGAVAFVLLVSAPKFRPREPPLPPATDQLLKDVALRNDFTGGLSTHISTGRTDHL